MMELTLESLGLTQEEFQDRVVSRVCQWLMSTVCFGDDEGEYRADSPLAKKLDFILQQKVDLAIEKLADERLVPNIGNQIETLCLQKTSQWGEKKGEKFTFIEYLVARAQEYLQEPVNFEGKARTESAYSNWNASTTRIAWLVNKHLQYEIETAMKKALQDANKSIVGGIEKAIKIKLTELAELMTVNLEQRRK